MWGIQAQILREGRFARGAGQRRLFKATVCDVLCNKGWHLTAVSFVLELGTAS
jgi:hypothetical protein